MTRNRNGTIVCIHLPGFIYLQNSTKCIGKYTINGSYGQVLSNYGWFSSPRDGVTFPFQMACINCINGLCMGVILTTYKSWDPPSRCSSNFMVEGSSPSKWPKGGVIIWL